jgi:hypothetical protein
MVVATVIVTAATAAPVAAPVAAGAAGVPFLQAQRMNSLTVQAGTDTFATSNAIGKAFTPTALNEVQTSLNTAVTNGSTSLILEFPGLTDLTGTNAASVSIGGLDGPPIEPAGNPNAYNGNSDSDWWYSPDPADIDAHGNPLDLLSGSITAHALTATATELPLSFGPILGTQTLSTVALQATTGAASHPLKAAGGFPPGHLPIENVPGTLTSFGSMSAGKVKGNISAASLATTPIPSAILSDCSGYTSANSLLDLLVSGCVFGGIITLVNPTQPDQVDPNRPPQGAGGPYHLIVNGSKAVIGCTDKNGGGASLSPCLAAAAYSSYFTFTTDRVIVHNPGPALALSPGSGTNGASFTINGTGFKAGGHVQLLWITGVGTTKVSLCSAPVASNGTFTCVAMVPPASNAGAAGPHLVLAKEGPRTKKATAEIGFDLS